MKTVTGNSLMAVRSAGSTIKESSVAPRYVVFCGCPPIRTIDEGKKLAPLIKMVRLVVPTSAVDWPMEVSVGTGKAATPTPLKFSTTCGFTGSSLATVKVPVRVPGACGVKFKVRTQKSPGTRGAVQFGRSKVKSAPVMVVCARSICSGAPPMF